MKFRSLKIITLLLVASFLTEQAAMAAPDGLEIPALSSAASKLWAQSSLSGLPDEAASLEEAHWAGPGARIVYLLQDAHTNLSAQRNSSRVIGYLSDSGKIDGLVCLEAADGDASLAFLRPFGDAKSRERAADFLLRTGRLQGSEYADLATDANLTLWGVEDKALYTKAVEAYREIASERARLGEFLGRAESAAESLRERFLNPALHSFDKGRRLYRAGKLPFAEYVEKLSLTAELAGVERRDFPHLALLGRLKQAEERIDFAAADREHRESVERLPASDCEELSAAGKSEAERAQYFAAFQAKLLKTSGKKFLNGRPYLAAYLRYLDMSRRLSAAGVLDELRRLESAVADALATSADEGRLVRVSEELETMRRLLDLTLTRAEFDEYAARRDEYDPAGVTGFLNRKLMEAAGPYGKAVFLEDGYDRIAARCEEFYRLTLERDEKLVENTLAKMETDKSSSAVLVAGGYHASNLKSLLKRRGVSFVSLVPRVLAETDRARYERLLLGTPAAPSALSSPVSGIAVPNLLAQRGFVDSPDGARFADFLAASPHSPVEVASALRDASANGPLRTGMSGSRLAGNDAEVVDLVEESAGTFFSPLTVVLYGALGALAQRWLPEGLLGTLVRVGVEYVQFVLVDVHGTSGERDAERIDERVRGLAAQGLPIFPGRHYFPIEDFDRDYIGPEEGGPGFLAHARKQAIHAVIAAVPALAHQPIAEKWVRRGVPVWVEKPLVLPHEVNRMRKLQAEHPGRVFAVDFFLYSDAFQAVLKDAKWKRILNEIGDIRRIEARMVENWGVEKGRGEQLMDPNFSGGGIGMDMGVHILALLDVLLARHRMSLRDLRFDDVYLARYREPDGSEAPGSVETYFWMKGALQKGRRKIDVAFDSGKVTDAHYYGLTLIGDKGRLEIFIGTDENEPYLRAEFDDGRAPEMQIFRGGGVGYGGVFQSFLEHAASLASVGSHPVDPHWIRTQFEASANAVETVARAYEWNRVQRGGRVDRHHFRGAPNPPEPIRASALPETARSEARAERQATDFTSKEAIRLHEFALRRWPMLAGIPLHRWHGRILAVASPKQREIWKALRVDHDILAAEVLAHGDLAERIFREFRDGFVNGTTWYDDAELRQAIRDALGKEIAYQARGKEWNETTITGIRASLAGLEGAVRARVRRRIRAWFRIVIDPMLKGNALGSRFATRLAAEPQRSHEALEALVDWMKGKDGSGSRVVLQERLRSGADAILHDLSDWRLAAEILSGRRVRGGRLAREVSRRTLLAAFGGAGMLAVSQVRADTEAEEDRKTRETASAALRVLAGRFRDPRWLAGIPGRVGFVNWVNEFARAPKWRLSRSDDEFVFRAYPQEGVILINAVGMKQMKSHELEAVLLHEVAHLRPGAIAADEADKELVSRISLGGLDDADLADLKRLFAMRGEEELVVTRDYEIAYWNAHARKNGYAHFADYLRRMGEATPLLEQVARRYKSLLRSNGTVDEDEMRFYLFESELDEFTEPLRSLIDAVLSRAYEVEKKRKPELTWQAWALSWLKPAPVGRGSRLATMPVPVARLSPNPGWKQYESLLIERLDREKINMHPRFISGLAEEMFDRFGSVNDAMTRVFGTEANLRGALLFAEKSLTIGMIANVLIFWAGLFAVSALNGFRPAPFPPSVGIALFAGFAVTSYFTVPAISLWIFRLMSAEKFFEETELWMHVHRDERYPGGRWFLDDEADPGSRLASNTNASSPATIGSIGIPVVDYLVRVDAEEFARIQESFNETRRQADTKLPELQVGGLTFARPGEIDAILRAHPEWGQRIETRVGGSLSTSRVLRQLGVGAESLRFEGYVGDDEAGRGVAETLIREGLSVEGLAQAPRSTSRTLVFVEPGESGRRTFLHEIGANESLGEANFERLAAFLRDRPNPVLHVGYEALSSEEYFLNLGRRLAELEMRVPGLIVVMDTVFDPFGRWVTHRAKGNRILRRVDYFATSLGEGSAISGVSADDPAAMAAWFLNRMPAGAAVLLKADATGSYVASSELGPTFVPSLNSETMARTSAALDGTGAGDAYVAGVVYGVSRGWDLIESTAFGTVLGGLAAGQVGGGTLGAGRTIADAQALYNDYRRKHTELFATDARLAGSGVAVLRRSSVGRAAREIARIEKWYADYKREYEASASDRYAEKKPWQALGFLRDTGLEVLEEASSLVVQLFFVTIPLVPVGYFIVTIGLHSFDFLDRTTLGLFLRMRMPRKLSMIVEKNLHHLSRAKTPKEVYRTLALYFMPGGYSWLDKSREEFEAMPFVPADPSRVERRSRREKLVELMGTYLRTVLIRKRRPVMTDEKDKDAIDFFLARVLDENEDPYVGKAAAKAVAKCAAFLDMESRHKAEQAFKTVLLDRNRSDLLQGAASRALVAVGGYDAYEMLLKALASEGSEQVRNYHLEGIALHLVRFPVAPRLSEYEPLVQALLKRAVLRGDSLLRVGQRKHAVHALGRLAAYDTRVCDALFGILRRDPSPTVQSEAVYALARMHSPLGARDERLRRLVSELAEYADRDGQLALNKPLFRFVKRALAHFSRGDRKSRERVRAIRVVRPTQALPSNPVIFVDISSMVSASPGGSPETSSVSSLMTKLIHGEHCVVLSTRFLEDRNHVFTSTLATQELPLDVSRLTRLVDRLENNLPGAIPTRDYERGAPIEETERIIVPHPGKAVVVFGYGTHLKQIVEKSGRVFDDVLKTESFKMSKTPFADILSEVNAVVKTHAAAPAASRLAEQVSVTAAVIRRSYSTSGPRHLGAPRYETVHLDEGSFVRTFKLSPGITPHVRAKLISRVAVGGSREPLFVTLSLGDDVFFFEVDPDVFAGGPRDLRAAYQDYTLSMRPGPDSWVFSLQIGYLNGVSGVDSERMILNFELSPKAYRILQNAQAAIIGKALVDQATGLSTNPDSDEDGFGRGARLAETGVRNLTGESLQEALERLKQSPIPPVYEGAQTENSVLIGQPTGPGPHLWIYSTSPFGLRPVNLWEYIENLLAQSRDAVLLGIHPLSFADPDGFHQLIVFFWGRVRQADFSQEEISQMEAAHPRRDHEASLALIAELFRRWSQPVETDRSLDAFRADLARLAWRGGSVRGLHQLISRYAPGVSARVPEDGRLFLAVSEYLGRRTPLELVFPAGYEGLDVVLYPTAVKDATFAVEARPDPGQGFERRWQVDTESGTVTEVPYGLTDKQALERSGLSSETFRWLDENEYVYRNEYGLIPPGLAEAWAATNGLLTETGYDTQSLSAALGKRASGLRVLALRRGYEWPASARVPRETSLHAALAAESTSWAEKYVGGFVDAAEAFARLDAHGHNFSAGRYAGAPFTVRIEKQERISRMAFEAVDRMRRMRLATLAPEEATLHEMVRERYDDAREALVHRLAGFRSVKERGLPYRLLAHPLPVQPYVVVNRLNQDEIWREAETPTAWTEADFYRHRGRYFGVGSVSRFLGITGEAVNMRIRTGAIGSTFELGLHWITGADVLVLLNARRRLAMRSIRPAPAEETSRGAWRETIAAASGIPAATVEWLDRGGYLYADGNGRLIPGVVEELLHAAEQFPLETYTAAELRQELKDPRGHIAQVLRLARIETTRDGKHTRLNRTQALNFILSERIRPRIIEVTGELIGLKEGSQKLQWDNAEMKKIPADLRFDGIPLTLTLGGVKYVTGKGAEGYWRRIRRHMGEEEELLLTAILRHRGHDKTRMYPVLLHRALVVLTEEGLRYREIPDPVPGRKPHYSVRKTLLPGVLEQIFGDGPAPKSLSYIRENRKRSYNQTTVAAALGVTVQAVHRRFKDRPEDKLLKRGFPFIRANAVLAWARERGAQERQEAGGSRLAERQPDQAEIRRFLKKLWRDPKRTSLKRAIARHAHVPGWGSLLRRLMRSGRREFIQRGDTRESAETLRSEILAIGRLPEYVGGEDTEILSFGVTIPHPKEGKTVEIDGILYIGWKNNLKLAPGIYFVEAKRRYTLGRRPIEPSLAQKRRQEAAARWFEERGVAIQGGIWVLTAPHIKRPAHMRQSGFHSEWIQFPVADNPSDEPFDLPTDTEIARWQEEIRLGTLERVRLAAAEKLSPHRYDGLGAEGRVAFALYFTEALRRLGRTNDRLAFLRRASLRHPEDKAVLLEYFKAAAKTDWPNEAVEVAVVAEPHYKTDPDFWLNTAPLYRRVHRTHEHLDNLKDALGEADDAGRARLTENAALWASAAMTDYHFNGAEEAAALLDRILEVVGRDETKRQDYLERGRFGGTVFELSMRLAFLRRFQPESYDAYIQAKEFRRYLGRNRLSGEMTRILRVLDTDFFWKDLKGMESDSSPDAPAFVSDEPGLAVVEMRRLVRIGRPEEARELAARVWGKAAAKLDKFEGRAAELGGFLTAQAEFTPYQELPRLIGAAGKAARTLGKPELWQALAHIEFVAARSALSVKKWGDALRHLSRSMRVLRTHGLEGADTSEVREGIRYLASGELHQLTGHLSSEELVTRIGETETRFAEALESLGVNGSGRLQGFAALEDAKADAEKSGNRAALEILARFDQALAELAKQDKPDAQASRLAYSDSRKKRQMIQETVAGLQRETGRRYVLQREVTRRLGMTAAQFSSFYHRTLKDVSPLEDEVIAANLNEATLRAVLAELRKETAQRILYTDEIAEALGMSLAAFLRWGKDNAGEGRKTDQFLSEFGIFSRTGERQSEGVAEKRSAWAETADTKPRPGRQSHESRFKPEARERDAERRQAGRRQTDEEFAATFAETLSHERTGRLPNEIIPLARAVEISGRTHREFVLWVRRRAEEAGQKRDPYLIATYGVVPPGSENDEAITGENARWLTPEEAHDDTRLALKVKKLRLFFGVGAEELARRAGISYKALHELEIGERGRPRPKTFLGIAAAFGIKPLTLLTGRAGALALRGRTRERKIELVVYAAGMTRDQAGPRIDLGPELVGRWIRGGSTWPENLVRLAHETEVDPSWILFDEPLTVLLREDDLPGAVGRLRAVFEERSGEFAALVGIDVATLRSWERGNSVPEEAEWTAYVRSVTELFYGEGVKATELAETVSSDDFETLLLGKRAPWAAAFSARPLKPVPPLEATPIDGAGRNVSEGHDAEIAARLDIHLVEARRTILPNQGFRLNEAYELLGLSADDFSAWARRRAQESGETPEAYLIRVHGVFSPSYAIDGSLAEPARRWLSPEEAFDRTTVAVKVRKLRAYYGLSVMEYADRARLHRTTVGYAERYAQGLPGPSTFLRLAQGFEREPLVLLTGRPAREALFSMSRADRVEALLYASGQTGYEVGPRVGKGLHPDIIRKWHALGRADKALPTNLAKFALETGAVPSSLLLDVPPARELRALPFSGFLRLSRHLIAETGSELAERSGISGPLLNRWETGKAVPDETQLRVWLSFVADQLYRIEHGLAEEMPRSEYERLLWEKHRIAYDDQVNTKTSAETVIALQEEEPAETPDTSAGTPTTNGSLREELIARGVAAKVARELLEGLGLTELRTEVELAERRKELIQQAVEWGIRRDALEGVPVSTLPAVIERHRRAAESESARTERLKDVRWEAVLYAADRAHPENIAAVEVLDRYGVKTVIVRFANRERKYAYADAYNHIEPIDGVFAFIGKAVKEQGRNGRMAIGDVTYEVDNREGNNYFVRAGQSDWQLLTAELTEQGFYRVDALGMGGVKEKLERSYAPTRDFVPAEKSDEKKVVLRFDLDALGDDLSYVTVHMPLLIREMFAFRNSRDGRNARFVVAGSDPRVQLLRRELDAFDPELSQSVFSDESDLHEFAGAKQITVTTPAGRVIKGKLHWYLAAPGKGELLNFRSMRLAAALARLDSLEGAEFERIRDVLQDLTGETITNLAQLRDAFLGLLEREQLTLFAVPPAVRLLTDQELRGARLARQMAEQAA